MGAYVVPEDAFPIELSRTQVARKGALGCVHGKVYFQLSLVLGHIAALLAGMQLAVYTRR